MVKIGGTPKTLICRACNVGIATHAVRGGEALCDHCVWERCNEHYDFKRALLTIATWKRDEYTTPLESFEQVQEIADCALKGAKERRVK